MSAAVPGDVEESIATEVHPRCVACDHELREHDPKGLRYCNASQTHGLSRGCICAKQG